MLGAAVKAILPIISTNLDDAGPEAVIPGQPHGPDIRPIHCQIAGKQSMGHAIAPLCPAAASECTRRRGGIRSPGGKSISHRSLRSGGLANAHPVPVDR